MPQQIFASSFSPLLFLFLTLESEFKVASTRMAGKNYTTEKKSYLPLSPDNHHLAQISTILADPAYVKMGDAVDLDMSDSSGSHHFVYTHQEPQSELKFRLEWNRVAHLSLAGVKLAYEFQLYSTTCACGLNLSVVVFVVTTKDSSASTAEKELASICCGPPAMPLGGQLIGTLNCEVLYSELMTFGVKYKGRQSLVCGCPCHGPSRPQLQPRPEVRRPWPPQK